MNIPISIVYSHDFLINWTTVGQISDSMMALAYNFHLSVGAWCLSLAELSVSQHRVFFSSDYPLVMSHFLCFSIVSSCVNLI